MRTSQATASEASRSDDGWAELPAARCRGPIEPKAPDTTEMIIDAGTALWALLDEATDATNEALAHAGVRERIVVERRGAEGIYRLTGPAGALREIRVALTISFVQGRRCGGASISTSETRLFGYLEPITIGDQLRRRVGCSGPEFAPEVVHDLFLSVFGDNPAATQRLSPISGMDLFQVPWN